MVDNKFTGAGGMADSQRRRKMKKISWSWAPLLLLVWGTIVDLSYSAASKTAMRKRIVNQARRMIGIKQKKIVVRGKSFRFDCSGFIFACYYGVGIDLEKKIDRSSVAGNLSYQLYKGLKGRSWKHRSRMPRPGDLIFFPQHLRSKSQPPLGRQDHACRPRGESREGWHHHLDTSGSFRDQALRDASPLPSDF